MSASLKGTQSQKRILRNATNCRDTFRGSGCSSAWRPFEIWLGTRSSRSAARLAKLQESVDFGSLPRAGPTCRSAVLESERKTDESAAGVLRSKLGKLVATGDGWRIRRLNRPWPLSLDAVSRKQVNSAPITAPAGVRMPLPVTFNPGSVRDRSSRAFVREGRAFRALDAESPATWRRACALPFVQPLIAQGPIVGTRELSALVLRALR